MLDQLEHSFSVDHEERILRQLQVINKKLNNNPHSTKHLELKKEVRVSKQEQKYFSEQCDELFNDDNYNKTREDRNSFDQSLFSSKNSLLLGNQYEKEIKNFKEYQTNKYSSQKQSKISSSKNSVQLRQSFQSKKAKGNDDGFIKKQTQNQPLKNVSQNNLNVKNKSKSSLKIIAESKIKKYIENKQNILPASNIQREKSFLKEVRKKIKFETQPDCCPDFYQQDSLENENNDIIYPLMQNYSRSRNKFQSDKNSLQCTFKPNILKKSSEIADNLQPSFERLTQDIGISKSQSKLPYKAKQQLSTKKYCAKRLEQLSQPRKLKTLANEQEPKYDFRPSLSKKSLEQMANCTMDVASRNKLWLQQKEAKIDRLKVEEQQKKQKQQGGTFVPKITPYKGQKQVHLSRYARQGISGYFQRVSMAKQKNEIQQKKKPQAKQEIRQSNVNMKKKSYDEAVKQLHKKIMTMNI